MPGLGVLPGRCVKLDPARGVMDRPELRLARCPKVLVRNPVPVPDL